MSPRLPVATIGLVSLGALLLGACASSPMARGTATPVTGPAATTGTVARQGPEPLPLGNVTTSQSSRFTTPPTAGPAPAGADQERRIPPSEFKAAQGLQPVYFEFDRTDVRPQDLAILDRNAGWMIENPRLLILIEGHADERGTNEYNLVLGDRRAKWAMNYLVAKGVGANRFTLVSYGEERPVCPESTDACWAKNRRAVFLTRPE